MLLSFSPLNCKVKIIPQKLVFGIGNNLRQMLSRYLACSACFGNVTVGIMGASGLGRGPDFIVLALTSKPSLPFSSTFILLKLGCPELLIMASGGSENHRSIQHVFPQQLFYWKVFFFLRKCICNKNKHKVVCKFDWNFKLK